MRAIGLFSGRGGLQWCGGAALVGICDGVASVQVGGRVLAAWRTLLLGKAYTDVARVEEYT